MKSRMLASTLLVMLLLLVPAVDGYTDSVSSPERTQGLVAPAPQGDHQLVALKGPGKFVSAQITKQGGNQRSHLRESRYRRQECREYVHSRCKKLGTHGG